MDEPTEDLNWKDGDEVQPLEAVARLEEVSRQLKQMADYLAVLASRPLTESPETSTLHQ